MSKERLEYFHKRYEEEKDIARHAGITFTKNEFKWLLDYAKEQAERVQELERELKEWGTVNEVWEEINTKLVEQNKHYRELINNINEKASLFGVDVPVYEAIQDAIKALEGES